MRCYFSISGDRRSLGIQRHGIGSYHDSCISPATHLRDRTEHRLNSCLAISTNHQYYRHFDQFRSFVKSIFQISWKKVTHVHITDYITYLLDTTNLAPTTIKSIISAISFFYKTKLNRNPAKSFATDLLLKNISKSSPPSRRLPITRHILDKLLLNLYGFKSKYLFHAFYFMYRIMYFLAMRISELLHYSCNFDHALRFQDIKLSTTLVTLKICSGKHTVQPFTYTLHCSPRFFWHMNEFLRLRGSNPGPLFCFRDGKPISRKFFFEHLKEHISAIGLNNKLYNTHSFRVGRTTDLALEGASDRQIALIGRWQLDAFKGYIRPTLVAL